MEQIIKIKALGISSEMEMNLDTIKDGLARNFIEYADELQKILKFKTIKKENLLNVTVGENTYRVIIDKDYRSGYYQINAFNLKTDKDVYIQATDFKVLSGCNLNKMMRYILEAIVACGNDAETTEAFDPYRRNGMKHYTVSWIRLETSYMAEVTDANFPTKEIAEQFAALLKGAGYKEVEIAE